MDRATAELILELALLKNKSLQEVYEFMQAMILPDIQPITKELSQELGVTTSYHWRVIYLALGNKEQAE